MSEIVIKVPRELEKQMRGMRENWSDVALTAIKLKILRKKLESKEEKELTRWSVRMGRKINEGAFKRLLSNVSPERRQRLTGK